LVEFGCCCSLRMSWAVISPTRRPSSSTRGKLLDPVGVQECLGVRQRDSRPGGDQAFPGRHQLGDRHARPGSQRRVAPGQDSADPPLRVQDHQAADLPLVHGLQGLFDGDVLADGDGVGYDQALGPLHPGHLLGLALGGQEAMDDPDSSGPGHGHGHGGLGHGVHVGREDGQVAADVSGNPTGGVHRVSAGDPRATRHQQDVIEGQSGLGPDLVLEVHHHASWSRPGRSGPFSLVCGICGCSPGTCWPGGRLQASGRWERSLWATRTAVFRARS